MSWLSVPTVPTRWRINIVIVSPLAGSRHSVFRVKDGCCSWSPYISLTLRYSTNRAVKEIDNIFTIFGEGSYYDFLGIYKDTIPNMRLNTFQQGGLIVKTFVKFRWRLYPLLTLAKTKIRWDAICLRCWWPAGENIPSWGESRLRHRGPVAGAANQNQAGLAKVVAKAIKLSDLWLK